MKLKYLKKLRDLEANATPGPWEFREDPDYYQGGTYIGIEPYHYVNGEKVPGCGDENFYFETDVFRDESGDAKFIVAMRNHLTELLDAAEDGEKDYKDMLRLQGNLIKAFSDLNDWKAKALEMAEIGGHGCECDVASGCSAAVARAFVKEHGS